MPRIIVLPNEALCPEGDVIEATSGETICDVMLANGIHIEHACEKSCACTTCHVIVREGIESLNEADELEEDMLDKAWGCLLYTSPSPRDRQKSRMPSSA